MYQRVSLLDGSAIGEPGPLPAFLVGLGDATVANLSWLEAPLATEYGATGFLVAPDPPPPPPSAAEVRVAIGVERDRRLAAGYVHDFGGKVGSRLLQTRDADDRINWLTSQAVYRAAIDAGQGDTLGARFRDGHNETIVVTFSQGHAALLAMAAWGGAIMAWSWALKDRLDAGEDPATFDLGQGWPAA